MVNNTNTRGAKPLRAYKSATRYVSILKDHFSQQPALPQVTKPYTSLDAIITGISVCTGWVVVIVLIYLGISRYSGGVSTTSLLLYVSMIVAAGFLYKDAIALYFKHTIRTDLLPKKY